MVLLGLDTNQGDKGWLGAACILLAAVGYAIGPLISPASTSPVRTRLV